MSDPPPTTRPRRARRTVIVSTTVLLAAIAAVPPVVSAVQRMAAQSISASTGGVAAGRDVHIDNGTHVQLSYVQQWWRGAQLIAGAEPDRLAPLAAAAPDDRRIEPESGALGRLVTNASLMDGATWTVEPSRVARQLQFSVRVDALMEPDKPGRLTVTLLREGKDLCTLGVHALSAKRQGQIHAESAECQDILAPGERATYKARLKAEGSSPVAVTVAYVDARRR